MGTPTRKTTPKKVTPSGLYSMSVQGLEVYFTPQNEQTGTEEVDVVITNSNGETLYKDADGTGQGYFAKGAQPGDWVAATRPSTQPTYALTRGNLSYIQINESDADGNAISNRKEGYLPFDSITKADLLEMASEDPAILAAHEAFIAASHAYMVALYTKATS